MGIEIRAPKTTAEWSDYYSLRYEVLRKPLGQAPGSEKNDGDLDGIHLALFVNQQIQAVARIDATETPHIKQVRFVAVVPNEQGKGYGQQIMNTVESICRTEKASEIILQARENALDFYLHLGYERIKKTHLLYGQVQHYLMRKQLD